MVITTPYATRVNPNRQTLRFKGVKESLKEILKELSQAGIESNQYLDIPEKIESTAPHLVLEPQLKMLYK
ncbi:MAG: dehydrogenase, partial [Cyanobacteria bacterium]|nr:dehydrogenase [Cyanobacteriota bacterium]